MRARRPGQNENEAWQPVDSDDMISNYIIIYIYRLVAPQAVLRSDLGVESGMLGEMNCHFMSEEIGCERLDEERGFAKAAAALSGRPPIPPCDFGRYSSVITERLPAVGSRDEIRY